MTVVNLASSCLLLAMSLSIAQLSNLNSLSIVPDGRRIPPLGPESPPNRLAYIDATHLEPYSIRTWEFDALNGLALNLQRNGYVPVMLHDFSRARLECAGLLVSIGPSRPFTVRERAQIRRFVEQGGVLISMVGAEEAAASNALLEDFGLAVPCSPVPTTESAPEPEPFGRTRADYLQVELDEDDRYEVAVRLHAAWPVEARADDAEVLAYGRNQLPVVESETELPVILQRAVGQGQVVLIGDTCFAMNKNLEYIGGQPFYGDYENARFWRWLLTRLRGEAEWIPPRPAARVPANGEDDAPESANDARQEEAF